MEELKGYEAFKNARENTGYSYREFAGIADISLSLLVYYENGQKSLLGMSVKKASEVFEILNISLYDFYMTYFFKELDVTDAVNIWKKDNPREYSVKKLYQRFKNRLFKLRERERITLEMHDKLYADLQAVFKMLENEGPYISDDFYEDYILDLEYQIGKCLEENLPEEEKMKNETAIRINDCILHSDFSYKDLAAFVGITNRRLSNCKNMENGYDDMKIENALKICNVFSKRFEDIFVN